MKKNVKKIDFYTDRFGANDLDVYCQDLFRLGYASCHYRFVGRFYLSQRCLEVYERLFLFIVDSDAPSLSDDDNDFLLMLIDDIDFPDATQNLPFCAD